MEKRGKEELKKIEETKIKLWAQSKKAQRQYYKNKIERQAYHGGKLYKSPLKKMMTL